MIALFLIWICFNARISWDVIAVGLAICLLTGILLKRAEDYSLKKEIRFILRMPALFRYLGILVKEMVMANIAMVKVILNPFVRLDGQLYFFTPKKLRSEYSRVLLANSITLTPGTITVQLKNGRYCVHTIKDEFVEDMENSTLTAEAERLEAKYTNE